MSKQLLKKINAYIPSIGRFPLEYMIPVYHCVSDEKLAHLKHIVHYKNIADFEKDLDFMCSKYEFVDWETFKAKCHQKNKKPLALLTFDDGLIEFKNLVMPILLRKGIYAINFINPAFVDNKEMMFRMKASVLIEEISTQNKKIPRSIFDVLGITSDTKEEVIIKLKQINYNNKSLLDTIASLLEYDFDGYLLKNKIYMDAQDLSEVNSKGFGIAAHSWDHPYFFDISLTHQLDNTQKSIDYIKQNGYLHDIFAFPFTDFGIKTIFFEQLFAANPDLKFTLGTAGIKCDSVIKNLQRVPMEMEVSAKEELHFEKNYFQLKKIFNKNRIIRS